MNQAKIFYDYDCRFSAGKILREKSCLRYGEFLPLKSHSENAIETRENQMNYVLNN